MNIDKQVVSNIKSTKKNLDWIKLCFTRVEPTQDSIFDYLKKYEIDDSIVIQEYSSRLFISRTTLIRSGCGKVYFWSCCNAKKKNHRPDKDHCNEILCVQKLD